MTGNSPLIVENSGDGIVQLVLNRPDKLNALSLALLEALRDALAAVSADDAARCVVISGNGRAFCAGHDLAEMRTMADRQSQLALFSLCSEVMQAIVACPVPVIAQVHGIATAAGPLVPGIDAAAPEDCVVLKELGQDARPATCIEVARRGKQMDNNPLRPRD